MRILYINHYAGGPRYGMEYRPYYLAREWVKAGHAVLVLAASFSHLRIRHPEVLNQPTEELQEGIRYRWFPTPAYAGNGVSRVRNILTFLWWLYQDGKRIAQTFNPDVVIASSTYPMDIWPARRIAKAAGAKLVFEVHDLWPLSPMELGGMSRWHPFILWVQWAEDTAYRAADLVVSMLPKIEIHTATKGLPSDRLAIVPNGISLDDWAEGAVAPLRSDVKAAVELALTSGMQIVAYTGSHGLPNALDTLLDAASLLRDEPICFFMVGDGHERLRLLARVHNERLTNVQMFKPMPKDQVLSLLSNVNMAYLGAPRHPIYRFGVSPNKMIDYMMASVPILYAIEAGNNPITEADCGISVSPENPSALAAAILILAKLPSERIRAMGTNARRYALARHTYNTLANSFLDAIERVRVRT